MKDVLAKSNYFSRIFLFFLSLPLSLVISNAQTIEEDTLIFKEDFGGNVISDPSVSSTPLDGCTLTLSGKSGQAGTYSLVKTGFNHQLGTWYSELIDHTYPEDSKRGYYISADVDLDHSGLFYSSTKDIDVCGGLTCVTSLYGMSLIRKEINTDSTIYAPAILRFYITDAESSNTVIAEDTIIFENLKGGVWEKREMSFPIPDGVKSIKINIDAIIYPVPGKEVEGCDFALDDIELRLIKKPTMDIGQVEPSYCKDSSLYVTSTVNSTDSYKYAWFKSTTGSSNYAEWTKYSEGQFLSIEKLKLTDSGYYRALAYKTTAPNTLDDCYPMTDIVYVNVVECCKDDYDTISTHICLSEYMFGIYGTDEDQLVNALKGTINVPEFLVGETDVISGKCDTFITHVTVIDRNPFKERTIEIKLGAFVSMYGFNFSATNDTSFVASSPSSTDCDSVLLINLKVLKPYLETISASVCPEENAYLWKGLSIEATNDTVVTLKKNSLSDMVRDTIYTLQLDVLDPALGSVSERVCVGELYDKHEYSFESTVDTTLIKHLPSKNGCDSTLTINLNVVKFDTIRSSSLFCDGDTLHFFDNVLKETGVYYHKIATDVCKVYVYDVEKVKRPGIKKMVTEDLGKTYSVLMEEENPSYVYFLDSLDNGNDNTFTDYKMGMHRVIVSDENNCKDTTSFKWFVAIMPDDMFTPNGDGFNDRWTIVNIEYYPDAIVTIFDRWGKQLIEICPYINKIGWDGIYKGNPCLSTDYWYIINVPTQDRQYVGHFTLMRF